MEKDKVLINVAPVSGACRSIVPEEIAGDVLECARRGAAMVHLHVRAKDGSLTANTRLLEETLKLIRSQSDIIIEVSTGGISSLSIKERCAPAFLPLVEACSLNVGSTNLGGAAYVNAPDDVEYCARTLLEHHKIPEVETFEIGHTAAMAELMEKYEFVKPVLFSIVLGHPGECPATPQALAAMAQFIPSGAVWGITHAHRTDFGIIAQALGMGARTVRIGFEDSNYLDRETQVDKNFPLVEKAARLIRAMDKEVMTPSEARAFLGIPQL